MTDEQEPLTPVQVEVRLRRLVSELTRAQQALATARDVEVRARAELRKARTRAFLSNDCPRVSRGGMTAGERDAWVADRVEAEQWVLDQAEVATSNAQDFLRVVVVQASVVQSLGVSVRQAYQTAGARE